MRKGVHLVSLISSLLVLCLSSPIAHAYVDAPPATFGRICDWSTHAIEVEVQSVDEKRHIIVWHKLADLKGRWPGGETVRQDLSSLPEPGRSTALRWAQPGRQTVIVALESYRWSHTYVDGLWYASQTGDWKNWNANRLMPLMLHSYCGPAARLAGATRLVLGGSTVIVACQVDAPAGSPPKSPPRVASLRASLKRLDVLLARDLVHWGAEDFTRLLGMAGFDRFAILPGVGPGARMAGPADFLGNGRPGVVLAGDARVLLLGNSDNALTDCDIPGLVVGARSAVWGDFDRDGKPDLLLATAEGPKLYHNEGNGKFTNVTPRLPRLPYWDLTAAAWIDVDGSGWPDILLADGYRGLRLLKNRRDETHGAPVISAALAFDDISDRAGLGESGLCARQQVESLLVADFSGAGRSDVLVGAGNGLLLLNGPAGLRVSADSGLAYDPRGVTPAAADLDHHGVASLFVPQRDGTSKLFANDGKGHFTDVIAHAGDLSRPIGIATCAAWGELLKPGRLCLVVGCERSPNRLFERQPNGTFVDRTESVGLQKRIFNTRAIAVADFDGDGTPDLLFNNEGQDSILLLGRAKPVQSSSDDQIR